MDQQPDAGDTTSRKRNLSPEHEGRGGEATLPLGSGRRLRSQSRSPSPKRVALARPEPAADAPPEAPDTPIVATPAPTYEEPRELNMESMEEDTAAFQKDAIWRELQVYKKRVARAEHDDKDKTARQRDYEKAFAAVNNVWAQLEEDLENVLASLPPAESAADAQESRPSSAMDEDRGDGPNGRAPAGEFLRLLTQTGTASSEIQAHNLNSKLAQKSAYTKNLLEQLLARIQSAAVRDAALRHTITTGTEPGDSSKLLKQEYDRVDAENSRLQLVYDELEARFHSVSQQVRELGDRLQLAEARNEELENQCDDLQVKLVQADRKLLRVRSDIARRYMEPPEAQQSTAQPSTDVAGKADNATAKDEQASGESGAATLTPDIIAKLREREELLEKYDVAEEMAQSRLKELEELRADRIRLKQDLDQALVDIHSLPESRIMESGAFKALKVQADYFRSDIDAQRQKTDQAMRDLEELRSKRREFEAKIVDEQSTRANALEKDLKRVSNDLARIRTMRDQLQAALGVEKAKNVKDESASADLRLSVSTNKERMRCLVEDVRRMKVRMAACSGDERLFKDVLFACELELAATSSSVDELNTEVEVPKIRSLVERLQERADLAEQESSRLRREMETLQGSDGGDDRRIAALAERESQLEQELKEARERLTKYESVFGDLDAITDGGMESRLVEMQEQIKKMQLKLRSYEQTEDAAMLEIESISNAFTALESRQSSQANTINQKDEQIARMLVEKAKHEQKTNVLHREKDVTAMKARALQTQLDKATELVKKLEADVTSKEALVTAAERELALAKSHIHAQERKIKDGILLVEELTVKIEKSGGKYGEFTTMLKQKEASLEKTRTVVRQLDEENRKLQSKIRTLNRRLTSSDYAMLAGMTAAGTNADDSYDVTALRQQVELLEGWRKIAQCSVCNYRAKSHVLQRCMHVFCKECVDKRLETRQRKCPTCGGAFGPNDVKAIYI